jgi:hypothetical protein
MRFEFVSICTSLDFKENIWKTFYIKIRFAHNESQFQKFSGGKFNNLLMLLL